MLRAFYCCRVQVTVLSMDTIRIALLTTSFPLTTGSVSGIFVYHLITHFPANIVTTVITPDSHGPVDSAIGDRIEIRAFRYAPKRLQLLAHRPGGIPVALSTNKWLYFLVPLFLISALISCVRFGRHASIIHANWVINGCIAGLVGKALGTPVLTTLRGEDVTRAQNYRVDRFLLRLCLSLSARVVVVSRAMQRWLYDEFPKIGHKVCLIESGIENVFLEIHKSYDVNESDSRVRVVTIGSLIPRKGIDQILQAVARATNRQNLQLSIVGTGPEADTLRQMVNDLGLIRNVRFVGQVAASDIPDILANADIFVLASHSEGRPNVVLEAMAAQLPVIATNIDGSNELIAHNENGLLFQDGAIEELTHHLESLSQDAKLRCRLGENARRFILEHDLLWSNTACRYSELYSSLL